MKKGIFGRTKHPWVYWWITLIFVVMITTGIAIEIEVDPRYFYPINGIMMFLMPLEEKNKSKRRIYQDNWNNLTFEEKIKKTEKSMKQAKAEMKHDGYDVDTAIHEIVEEINSKDKSQSNTNEKISNDIIDPNPISLEINGNKKIFDTLLYIIADLIQERTWSNNVPLDYSGLKEIITDAINKIDNLSEKEKQRIILRFSRHFENVIDVENYIYQEDGSSFNDIYSTLEDVFKNYEPINEAEVGTPTQANLYDDFRKYEEKEAFNDGRSVNQETKLKFAKMFRQSFDDLISCELITLNNIPCYYYVMMPTSLMFIGQIRSIIETLSGTKRFLVAENSYDFTSVLCEWVFENEKEIQHLNYGPIVRNFQENINFSNHFKQKVEDVLLK
jgi:hypothetical protein